MKKKSHSVRECLLPGCGRKLSRQFEFCKDHERLVPPVLLNALKRTRALYEKHLDFNTVKNELHRKQWQLARGVSIVAVQHALGQISPEQMAKLMGNRPPAEPETKEVPYVDSNENSGGSDQDRG